MSRGQWVEPQTGDQRVVSLRLTAGGVTVLCPVHSLVLSNPGNHRDDWKIVDWDVKPVFILKKKKEGGFFPSIYKIGGNFQILGGPQTSLDHVMKTLFIPLKHFYLYLHVVTILLSCKANFFS